MFCSWLIENGSILTTNGRPWLRPAVIDVDVLIKLVFNEKVIMMIFPFRLTRLCLSPSSVSHRSRLREGRGGDSINCFAAGHLQEENRKGPPFFWLVHKKGTRPSDECALCSENSNGGNNNGGERGERVRAVTHTHKYMLTHTRTKTLWKVLTIKCGAED